MAETLPNFAEPRWFACHTKPRCEKKFAAVLAAEGFPHYLPLVPSVRRYRDQTKRFTKPLFPGYVFAEIPPETEEPGLPAGSAGPRHLGRGSGPASPPARGCEDGRGLRPGIEPASAAQKGHAGEGRRRAAPRASKAWSTIPPIPRGSSSRSTCCSRACSCACRWSICRSCRSQGITHSA